MSATTDRRRFLQTALAAAAVPAVVLGDDQKKPRLKKAVKFGMIGIKAPIREKFELIKSLGFQGVEMDSPSGVDKDEAVRAVHDTGIVIHGVIDSVHWKDTLSDPNEEVRARGLAALKTALEDAKVYGATTALLVPGVVNKNVSYQQCWDRSQAEVRKALPLAEKLGVKIAIECVWNNFITKPEQMVEYVDAFGSPYVGSYFDCSNMVKYGVKSGDWIRALGKRVLKFDFKGYSKAKGWVKIGEGDEDWPDILKALAEVGYNGWATAEVDSGGREHLQDVADRMNKILELK
jgi:hexulose-6-phosphate isomerase